MDYKEKAKELIKKIEGLDTPYDGESGFNHNAKQCALIAVDEIINLLSRYTGMHDQEFFDADLNFYKYVKEEINKQ